MTRTWKRIGIADDKEAATTPRAETEHGKAETLYFPLDATRDWDPDLVGEGRCDSLKSREIAVGSTVGFAENLPWGTCWKSALWDKSHSTTACSLVHHLFLYRLGAKNGFCILDGWKKNQKNISWYVKVAWKKSQCLSIKFYWRTHTQRGGKYTIRKLGGLLMGHLEGSAFQWDGKLLEVLNKGVTRFYCDWLEH